MSRARSRFQANQHAPEPPSRPLSPWPRRSTATAWKPRAAISGGLPSVPASAISKPVTHLRVKRLKTSTGAPGASAPNLSSPSTLWAPLISARSATFESVPTSAHRRVGVGEPGSKVDGAAVGNGHQGGQLPSLPGSEGPTGATQDQGGRLQGVDAGVEVAVPQEVDFLHVDTFDLAHLVEQ